MTDWQEAYYDLVNKVECECVQQGDLVPIWDQFKRMSLTITKLHGHQGAMETELAKFKALAETLAGALGTAIPYIVEQATPCNGYKCREPWCLSCNYDEEDAEAAAGNGKAAKADATEALREYKEARDAS